MRDITLWTAKGLHFVATVQIAPFPDQGMPEVVLWGARVFRARDVQPTDGPWVYHEVFAVASLTTSEEAVSRGYPQSAQVLPVQAVDRSAVDTLHGTPPGLIHEVQQNPTGMHDDYLVLSDAERAKGFVRPVRRSYRHVGPPGGKGCGTVTTMGQRLAETYARDPKFYGATFCCGCNVHLPVGPDGEFVWDDTDERVGT